MLSSFTAAPVGSPTHKPLRSINVATGMAPHPGAMTKRIAIIQGHPDASSRHLRHAMADAYAEGAALSGHEMRRIEVASLEFPLLRTQADFEKGAIPPALKQAQEDMRWAEHWVFLF